MTPADVKAGYLDPYHPVTPLVLNRVKSQKMADLEGNPFSDPEGINPFAVSRSSVGFQ